MDQDNMAQPDTGAGALSVGHVISRTISVYLGNLPAFLFMGLLVALIPVMFGVALAGEGFLAGQIDFQTAGGIIGIVSILAFLLSMVLGAVLQGAVVYGSVKYLEGTPGHFRETVGKGLVMALPLLGISIIFTIGMMFSFMLLIVPGLIFLCVYIVTVPAAVVDRTGVFSSFSRSAELTRGNRWRIFLIFVLCFLIALLVGGVFGLVFGSMSAFLGDPSYQLLVSALMEVVINAVMMGAYACLAAVLYVELRALREGPQGARISAVFD
jgi:hypothetical protein